MKQLSLLVAASLLVVACGTAAPSGSPSSSATASPIVAGDSDLGDIGAGLRGPDGLVAGVYASGLKNASAFAFDSSGRLWVATAAYSDEGSDAVYVVARSGATPQRVLDGVHTPLGLLWLNGSLYVAAANGVVAYSGFDGSTFARTRTILTVASGVGEVNGIAVADDGRLSLGISAPTDHDATTQTLSASVISFEPDGSDMRVEATDIRAPVGLAFDSKAGHLLVSMDQRDDLGDQTPGDLLAVVTAGQDWGFPACYGQGGSACANSPTPLAVLDRHAAVAGVAVVDGQLGASIGHAAVVAEWSLGRLVVVPLGAGSTPVTPSVLITGIGSPVAVATGPDGAVYAGDWATGTVYRIGASGP